MDDTLFPHMVWYSHIHIIIFVKNWFMISVSEIVHLIFIFAFTFMSLGTGMIRPEQCWKQSGRVRSLIPRPCFGTWGWWRLLEQSLPRLCGALSACCGLGPPVPASALSPLQFLSSLAGFSCPLPSILSFHTTSSWCPLHLAHSKDLDAQFCVCLHQLPTGMNRQAGLVLRQSILW